MFRAIRPHRVFGLYRTDAQYERMVKIVLPGKRSPILLETALLVALSKVCSANRFFEFGTYLGETMLNIVANQQEDARAYALDLDDSSFFAVVQHQNDRQLSRTHLEMTDRLAFKDTPYASKITRLFGDSKTFDFGPYREQMDLIFIDGGHDLATVKSDSENAFFMLTKAKPACIVWHDYGNPMYPELTKYVRSLGEEHDVFHVEETMICFRLTNIDNAVTELLN